MLFAIHVTAVHGGDLTGERGQLASPLYPNQHPHNAEYAWTITVPNGMYVYVEFRDIDLERSTVNLGRCAFDFVKVSNAIQSSFLS